MAAAVMTLLHSARLNGHEPHAYLGDVLQRLPTQPLYWRAAAASLASQRIALSTGTLTRS